MPVIKKDDVTKTKIAKLLNSAAIETRLDDDDDGVYAEKGGIDFGVFVKLIPETSQVKLWTYMQCKDGVSTDALREFVCKLNSDYRLVKFTHSTYEDGRAFVNGEYEIFCTFGLSSENFIVTLKRFAKIFVGSITEEDKEDVFFS
jgi:hypothetical protein